MGDIFEAIMFGIGIVVAGIALGWLIGRFSMWLMGL